VGGVRPMEGQTIGAAAQAGEGGAFLKSRDAKQTGATTSDERRTVRHSRMSFRGERGVRCEECGDALSPTHAFALYGCWCVRCWRGGVPAIG